MGKVATLQPALTIVDVRIGKPLADSADFSDPRRGSRHERGYGTEWDKLRKVILARDRYLCLACLRGSPRRLTPANHVDHIVEKADGGTDDPQNLQSLCKPCHDVKSAGERARRRAGGR